MRTGVPVYGQPVDELPVRLFNADRFLGYFWRPLYGAAPGRRIQGSDRWMAVGQFATSSAQRRASSAT
jgi:hypothetical protein